MRVLELFSGTHSVGKICKEKGWEVVSLDLQDADINISILDWDYKKDFKPGDFDIVWASPPCHTFSILRRSWIGRKLKKHGGQICTRELLDFEMETEGLPLLRKAQEIIEYFKPNYYFIENPKTGRMKEFLDLPFYDVDYCRYAPEWGYKKSTRIWTNLLNFKPLTCVCKGKHTIGIGQGTDRLNLKDKYRIPPSLINEIFKLTLNNFN